MIRTALSLLLLLAARPCRADEQQVLTSTTDTPAYCTQLVRQLADRHSAILDVQRLLADGREMCERGQVRGGIRRLRRALVLLHGRPAPP